MANEHRRRWWGLALAALAMPVEADAQSLVDENLLTGLPSGFEVAMQGSQGQMHMMEFIPSGESVEDWSVMITVQTFRGIENGDGDALARQMERLWLGTCKGAAVERLGGGQTNGYPFVLWSFACPKSPMSGKPESTWLKAIGGADAMYVVQYAYRQLPSDELAEPALSYLAGASVCDTRRPDRPCPPGM
jgi:hypothetical protein